MPGFTTNILHTPYLRKDACNTLRFPVYDSAAFSFETAEAISASFRGELLMPAYTRTANPTVEHFEQVVKRMSGATGVLALSSGMAAINVLLMASLKAGDNVITSNHLFGNTYALFSKTLKPFGIEFRYANMANPQEIERLIDSNTKIFFFEILSNPQLEVIDVKQITEIAKKHNILTVCDSTLTTPYIFEAKAHGINVEILSSTKYFSGGGTGIGGMILDYGTFNWSNNQRLEAEYQKFGNIALQVKLRRDVFRNTGSCMSPHNAYMHTLGLETLALRADRTCQNALQLAEFLDESPNVLKVYYPGLKTSPYYEIAKNQFKKHFGGIITIELANQEKCFQFLNKLKIIHIATNMNDNKSLAIHPFSTIYSEFSLDEIEKLDINSRMIRISVGIEDIEDLITDVQQALQ